MSIAIVAGALASKARNGGFAWVPLSYALGLRRLGFDVYMVEQAGAGAELKYFDEVMGRFGFCDRNAVLPRDDGALIREVAASAELLVNISGNATESWVVGGPRLTAYVDTDPGFTQIWNRAGQLHQSLHDHSHHFSVGSNLGQRGCLVPDDGIQWRPSRPPVVLEWWPAVQDPIHDIRFTTVSTWRCPAGLVSLDGENLLPSKLHEFRRMLPLPGLAVGASFEIALDIQPADEVDREKLVSSGWRLVDPHDVAGDPCAFRDYVGASAAEFSTAQGVYTAANTGWISDRSVRYLASGRPALVQATGVSKDIAREDGMLTFTTLDEARRQAERIVADYDLHAFAARQIADECFDSDRVLGEMLDDMGARP